MTVEIKHDAPILTQIQEHWAKLAAMLVYKLSPNAPVVITNQDMEDFVKDGRFLMTWGHKDSIEFRLVTEEEGDRLHKHVEGLGGIGIKRKQ